MPRFNLRTHLLAFFFRVERSLFFSTAASKSIFETIDLELFKRGALKNGRCMIPTVECLLHMI